MRDATCAGCGFLLMPQENGSVKCFGCRPRPVEVAPLLVTLTAAALTGLLASPHTSELSQSDLVALAVSHALAMRAALGKAGKGKSDE